MNQPMNFYLNSRKRIVYTHVSTIFNISRFIYDENYDKIKDIYKKQPIPTELALVIGSITETQKIIDDALAAEGNGGEMNMCKAIEKLEAQCRETERIEGRIEGAIQIYKKMHTSKFDTLNNIIDDFSINKDVAMQYIEKFW